MRFVITFNKVLCMYVCMYVCLLYRAQPVKRGSDNLSDLNRYQQKNRNGKISQLINAIFCFKKRKWTMSAGV